MKWQRRVETVLALAGVSFLGVSFTATSQRWDYQARQERALMRSAEMSTPWRDGRAESGAATRLSPVEADDADLDPRVLGTLEIPRLGVAAIVREGDDDATLDLAIGHLPGTARPGEPGNVVLAAHRDTFFRALQHVELKDRVLLFVPPRHYEYQVSSIQVVAPTEIGVLASTGIEELTLLTCYPFDFIGSAPKRFVVRAVRFEPKEILPSR